MALRPPARAALLDHVSRACGRYWPDGAAPVHLPVRERPFPEVVLPLRLVMVALPPWAECHAVDGAVAVPAEACADAAAPAWQEVDWWLAAFLLLECWHERVREARHGTIHSYSARLHGWDERAWARAWVNRIALFLALWARRDASSDEPSLALPVPRCDVVMTHDVDAVAKTAAIRLKQCAFLGFNALRLLLRARVSQAAARARQAVGFALRPARWSALLGEITELERAAGMRSRFHLYAGRRGASARRWLFDPAYDLADAAIGEAIESWARGGWAVGLHLSFDAWRSVPLGHEERARLEARLGRPATVCRQHWLRFSFADTWAAQAGAGLGEDTTLMFNDRPGLRNAAALAWAPWDARRGAAHDLHALPTVIMDSHLYDYRPMTPGERRAALGHWLDELVAVGGQAALLWHPHTLASDYGWRDGFVELLGQLRERAITARA